MPLLQQRRQLPRIVRAKCHQKNWNQSSGTQRLWRAPRTRCAGMPQTSACVSTAQSAGWGMQGARADGGPKALLLRHVNQLQLGSRILCHVNGLRAGFS